MKGAPFTKCGYVFRKVNFRYKVIIPALSFFAQARYKQSLDPTVDEVKKLCTSLRRNAKEERVLFHYNGHGVPRPTVNGEIWVFNKVSPIM